MFFICKLFLFPIKVNTSISNKTDTKGKMTDDTDMHILKYFYKIYAAPSLKKKNLLIG